MSQPRHRPYQMGGGNNAGGHGQFGDTTYTKIFVGGLAWETQRDTMRRYFEQFGEIQEAVVITDKNTGRSKGYGFVTFRDPDSAIGACQDPSPVIDGRRANCNLASLGAQQRPTRPSAPQHHGMGRYRPALMAPPAAYQGSYFHQQPHYAYPYSPYGYSGYPQDNMYPMNYYNVYGGQQQYPPYYTAAASASTPPGVYPNFYPVYAQSSQAAQAQGYGIQYPQMVQYPYVPPGILSAPTSVPSTTSNTTGVTTSPVGVAGTSTTSQTAAATTTTTEHGSSPS